ncbi:MAG: hypothetical protein Kow00124_06600 [Anaerolineae bacterium]
MTDRRTGHTAVIQQAFKGLDRETLDMLREFAEKKTFPANHVICAEGDIADAFYLITSGRVMVSRAMQGEGDEAFILGFLGPGQYFGELGLISDERRAATVTAIVDTEVLEITRGEFEQAFTSSPAMARSLLATLVGIIRQTDQRAIEDLEKRNAELAKAYADLEAAQADRIARAALEAQLEVAARAQRSMLPTALPDVPGYQFAAQFEPARHIGGDFYDIERLENGKIAMVVADVSDKGPHAALFMAVARTLFLVEGQHYGQPIRVARAVHEGLIRASGYEMFVTAVFAILDPQTGVFRYVRAGHDEPLLVRRDGSVELLTGRGRFMGLWASPPPAFEEQEVKLSPGDSIILYSDGVTDMRNAEGKPFGRDRLQEVAVTVRNFSAERIARGIYGAVQRHRGLVDAFDDFTLLVVRAE